MGTPTPPLNLPLWKRGRGGLIASVFAFAWFAFPQTAHAADVAVTGWAWSGTAGWISMHADNCVALNAPIGDTDPCTIAGIRYGVTINDTGYLTGYAWSRAAGWICVGATCAGSGGAIPPGGWTARVNAVTQQAAGWAKALAFGDDGWVSLSCDNQSVCATSAYRTTWVPPAGGVGALEGYAWNGPATAGSRSLGWIQWNALPASGGIVTTAWDPEPRCSGTGAQCVTDRDCVLLGEQCCLGGAPCGRCAGTEAWCALHADCTPSGEVLCCPPGVQCGRCIGGGSSCGADQQCTNDFPNRYGECCPPGAVCTVEVLPPPTGPEIATGTFAGTVGFCGGTATLCVDDAQCAVGVACVTDPAPGLCANGTACSSANPCADGSACDPDVGLCAVNAADGTSRPCLDDGDCTGLGDGTVRCLHVLGECTDAAEDRLCVADANCAKPGSRCGELFLPWLQTEFGSVYGGQRVGSPQTPAPPTGEYNATYCILSGGPIINFLSAAGCGEVRQTPYGQLTTPGQPLYASAVGRLDIAGITSGRYGTVVPASSASIAADAGNFLLGGQVHSIEGTDLDVGPLGIAFRNGVGEERGAGLIVVRGGDLTIRGNVRYADVTQPFRVRQLASPGWLVLRDPATGRGGNITIDPSVTDLVGAFYAEGRIATGAGANALRVRGVLVAREFRFERELRDEAPAERITADGRVLTNTPPGFGDLMQSLPAIRRVAE